MPKETKQRRAKRSTTSNTLPETLAGISLAPLAGLGLALIASAVAATRTAQAERGFKMAEDVVTRTAREVGRNAHQVRREAVDATTRNADELRQAARDAGRDVERGARSLTQDARDMLASGARELTNDARDLIASVPSELLAAAPYELLAAATMRKTRRLNPFGRRRSPVERFVTQRSSSKPRRIGLPFAGVLLVAIAGVLAMTLWRNRERGEVAFDDLHATRELDLQATGGPGAFGGASHLPASRTTGEMDAEIATESTAAVAPEPGTEDVTPA